MSTALVTVCSSCQMQLGSNCRGCGGYTSSDPVVQICSNCAIKLSNKCIKCGGYASSVVTPRRDSSSHGGRGDSRGLSILIDPRASRG